jgi:hypothetical protein
MLAEYFACIAFVHIPCEDQKIGEVFQQSTLKKDMLGNLHNVRHSRLIVCASGGIVVDVVVVVVSGITVYGRSAAV